VKKRFYKIPNLFLLGNNELPKVSIFTFLVKSRTGMILHPMYVVALLNDLFGIQSRAGCQCASIYGQNILGIDMEYSRKLKESLMAGNELMRIGFTRINFNYFLKDEEIDYICDAIEFLCNYGWMMLPHYKLDKDLGYWKNRDEQETTKHRSWLGEIDYSSGKMKYLKSTDETVRSHLPFYINKDRKGMHPLSHYTELAKQHLVEAVIGYKSIYGKSNVDQRAALIGEEYHNLVWFLFPSQVLKEILEINANCFEDLKKYNEQHPVLEEWSMPFTPRDFTRMH
jgi:hypothetical protein